MFQFDSDAVADALDASATSSAGVAPIVATDGERLMQFRRHRDQAALAEVVEAHAAMVWGVCSQVLRQRHDVEDAFQATFLILARKANSIRAADSAAGWLYRVAFRTSLLVRSQQRRRAEQSLVDEPAAAVDQLAGLERHEQCLTLLEELHALPHRYRQPLVLCYFEGKSRREAAGELGVTTASVKGLLARGTRMLRTRMVRRGAALSTAMAATTAAMASAPALAAPALAASTAALAASFAMKSTFRSIGGALKTGAAVTLAEKGILAMTIAAAAKPAAVVLAVCLTTGLWAVAAEKPKVGGVASSASPVLLAETAAPAEAAAEAKASAEPVDVQPSDPAPEPAEPPLVQPPLLTPAAPPTNMPMPRNESVELQAVELEMEHWDLKAEGLEKKGHVLAMKAKRLKESGQASGTEILEMEAEAALMGAEMLLCESKSMRLKEEISAIERRHAARTPSAPPVVQPVILSGRAYYPAPAPSQPTTPMPDTAAPAANPYYYGTPQAPVPAAPQWNNNGTGEAPTPAPATTKPQTAVVSAPPGWAAPSGWAVQQHETPPHARFVVVGELAEELKRKFDAKRAANPQMSDAEFLRAFVNEKLMELQTSNAIRLTESQPAYRAPATYPFPPPMVEDQTRYQAPQPVLEASDTAKELAKLKKENAALKKRLEARADAFK